VFDIAQLFFCSLGLALRMIETLPRIRSVGTQAVAGRYTENGGGPCDPFLLYLLGLGGLWGKIKKCNTILLSLYSHCFSLIYNRC
jgi:hypothetical protein